MWPKGTKIQKNLVWKEIGGGDLPPRGDWMAMESGARGKTAAQFTTGPTKI